MAFLAKFGVFVLLVKVLGEHPALCNKVSIRSVKSITRTFGQDVVFMWNITNGQIMEVRFGLLRDGFMRPQLVYMSHGYGPVFSSNSDADATRYKGRMHFVGDLNKGHAWFKITNLNFQDGKTYVAAIQELGTDIFVTSSIALTVKASAHFTRVPANVLRVRDGETAKLVWDYHVTAREIEFSDISPIWNYYTRNHGDQRIAFEHKNHEMWTWAISSECPARLLNPVRVRKEGRATLIISNVTTADSGVYGCGLMLKTGLPIVSQVELIVTGAPVEVFVSDIATTKRPKTNEIPPESPVITGADTVDMSIKINWDEPESHGYPVLMYSVHSVELNQLGQEVTSHTYHVNEDVHQYEVGEVKGEKTYRLYVTAWNTHGESVKDQSKSVTVKVH